jgi:hypothetical protein
LIKRSNSYRKTSSAVQTFSISSTLSRISTSVTTVKEPKPPANESGKVIVIQKTVIQKTEPIKHNNLRGVMFWELSGDFPTSHERSLLSAAYHGLSGKKYRLHMKNIE